MSLTKQLWIAIIIILLSALGGSFFISTLSARHYLEQQLQLKNIDNATSLALSMSQLEKDPVTLELLIAAQFDSGHYEYIRFTDPKGGVIAERHYASTTEASRVPHWFSLLLTIDVTPGTAKVQDGWQQYGTIELQSHSDYAIASLWQSTLKLLQWFVMAAIISGLIGTVILKTITRPLRNVITQAEAIGQRLFVTSAEPKTREFRRLVQAMNRLSAGVKSMLDQETQKLQKLQQEAQHDPVTGLANREHFLNLLESTLTREDSASCASICVLRLRNLAELNKTLGHARVDKLLQSLAEVFNNMVLQHKDNYAGRLNGTDFCLVSFNDATLAGTAQTLSERAQKVFHALEVDLHNLGAPIAGCYYQTGDSRGLLLSRLDGALAAAEQKGNFAIVTQSNHIHSGLQRNLDDWRQSLTDALAHDQLKLGKFAVRTIANKIIHTEKPVRLYIDNDWKPAGYFVGWATRLDLLHEIDHKVLLQAINDLAASTDDIAINISEDSLCSAEFRLRAISQLRHHPALCHKLWIEFPESCAVRHLPQLREFCHELRSAGCKVGLEHVGSEFTRIRELQDIGLHYLKIDSALTRNIDTLSSNHQVVQGLCTIGHSLGLIMIAEGVTTEAEKTWLARLGMDGLTGPGVPGKSRPYGRRSP
ncbi:MAG TPA: LapD/MoxY N-terminal periplasmic domain-containing protein, partial [Cellvibrionaceae bacterium]